MNTAEVLLSAAALLSKKNGWIQQNLALTASGVNIAPGDKDACRFCLVGAIYHVIGVNNSSSADLMGSRVLKQLAKTLGIRSLDRYRDLCTWNDKEQRTKREVIALLKQGAKEWQQQFVEGNDGRRKRKGRKGSIQSQRASR